MRTLALDATGDIEIPARWMVGAEAYAQRLRSRFQFFKGEWFLDQRKGAAWLDTVLGHDPNKRVIRAVITEIIMKTPETESIKSFDIDYNGTTRQATVSNLQVIWGGRVLNFQSEQFIMRLGAIGS